jgi:Mg/Co/Ni transporter MgtE
VKHLEAGLIVGGAWAVIVVVAVGLINILNWLVGTGFTVAIFATTVIVIGVASFIDWKTERGS